MTIDLRILDGIDFPEALREEILSDFVTLAELVSKWNPTINVVAKSTISDLWQRHIIDSAQIFSFTPAGAKTWVDLGSGGGFPGLVVGIMAKWMLPDLAVTLVESDQRKAVFLSQSVRLLDLAVRVEVSRIESLAPQGADVVSARALASLPLLCEYAHRHLAPNGIAILHKGAQCGDELEQARKAWTFDLAHEGSITDPGGSILVLRELRRV